MNVVKKRETMFIYHVNQGS